MNKKKLVSLSLVVIMVAILSFSTLAWFTADDAATNDFIIEGAGTGKPEDIFSIDVKENVDGKDEAVDEMDFEKVLPNDTYKKEAFITNTGSYEQYIRVVMTITDWNLIKDIVTVNMDYYFNQNWEIRGARVVNDVLAEPYTVDADGNLVVTMYLNKKLQPGETVDIMDYVYISKDATQADFANEAFKDGFQIIFDADAAQTENILNVYDADREWYNAMKTFESLENP